MSGGPSKKQGRPRSVWWAVGTALKWTTGVCAAALLGVPWWLLAGSLIGVILDAIVFLPPSPAAAVVVWAPLLGLTAMEQSGRRASRATMCFRPTGSGTRSQVGKGRRTPGAYSGARPPR